jgi:Family of unknown function (DUF5829)
MKKIVNLKFLIFVILMSSIQIMHSQFKMDANTIFVCIPAEDYTSLFSNSFVKDTLFICKENTTKTSTSEYTGKYFIGEFATLEFMQPSENNKFGDHLNDIGIEFKSRKIGLLDSLKKTNTNFEIEKVYLESDTEKHLWYDDLQLKKYKTNLEFSVLEYSAEELKTLGFADDEIKKSISPTDFNKIVYEDHKYPRKFKSIKSIKMEVNADGLNYLKQISKAFHFKMNNNSITYNGFIIYYTLNKNLSATKLKNITLNLIEDLKSKKIELTTHISISISKNTATFDFRN